MTSAWERREVWEQRHSLAPGSGLDTPIRQRSSPIPRSPSSGVNCRVGPATPVDRRAILGHLSGTASITDNRTEEAIGSALDLWTAYREDAFGKQPPPFVGWLMMVEDAHGSRDKVKVVSPHYAIFEEFKNTSYLERDDLLGQRMVKE